MFKINPDYMKKITEAVNESPYFSLLSMKLVEFDVGYSLLEIPAAEKHIQPFGVVHGGVFATIVDAAAFWAVYPGVDENVGMTSVDLKLNYLAPAVPGSKLIARGRCVKLGKTLGLGEAEVMDAQGRILTYGSSTLMMLPDFPFKTREPLPAKFVEAAEV